MSEQLRAGFIGLGSQGAPMARRIVDGGFPLTLWARRPDTLVPFADTAAKTASTPAELAANSDVIGLCVRDDSDIEQIVSGEDGVLAGIAPGAIIAVHSTVHPDTVRVLADRAAKKGAFVVDAPVSGGQPAASVGRLLVMVGGAEEHVERARPVFATYGDPVVHLGPLGAGQVTKLLNNTLFTAHLAVGASLLKLGRDLSVDPAGLATVIRHGSGESFALARVADAGGTLDRIAGHAGPLLAKDVRLTVAVAEAAGVAVDVPVVAAADAALALMNVTR
ncbi:MAG: 6-phosphogluconate dehydrogenase [Actinomycetia bacterium]|nr:6-phosphogluconate dehydrogenase [Actinomycetes bacterium]